MTADIYRQHEVSFPQVSAFVVVKDGERAATVAFKFPKDGAGRLYCYLHVIGIPMVRGSATGFGYDKRSAAAEAAARLVDPAKGYDGAAAVALAIRAALKGDSGYSWDRRVEDAGFKVWQAV